MRKSTCRSTYWACVLATCVGLSLLMSAPAYSQLIVSRAITEINSEKIRIVEAGEIAKFLADVPNSTIVSFTMQVNVKADGEDLMDLVVSDRFGGELAVQCVSFVGTCDITTKGRAKKAFLNWKVGDLADGTSETLTVVATTKVSPDGEQAYAECGVHDLNSGVVAKASVNKITSARSRGPKTKQLSFNTESITLRISGTTPIAFPECSNCVDDDTDGLFDLDDPDCSDPLDNDEDIF